MYTCMHIQYNVPFESFLVGGLTCGSIKNKHAVIKWLFTCAAVPASIGAWGSALLSVSSSK